MRKLPDLQRYAVDITSTRHEIFSRVLTHDHQAVAKGRAVVCVSRRRVRSREVHADFRGQHRKVHHYQRNEGGTPPGRPKQKRTLKGVAEASEE